MCIPRKSCLELFKNAYHDKDMGWYVVSDGSEFPYRTKIRTGSFSAMSIVDKVSRGLMIADLIALIASLDVVAPEVDR